ncbi:tetratricopeptide repeat protein [Flavobacterium dauae]|uniref:tetratricopeptide repeat protein n=1 Tax=Flavobacterium dauae TaxID=1563479 RepID=UPI00101B257E|nr:tetratricopeptide repeat protein [Flavobacterium dauae]WLD22742.1 tetratricopeptide repeat protein [Flavobacterium dauae]
MSKNKIPTINQMNWFSTIPQLIFMGILIIFYYLLNINDPILWGALTYLVLSYGLKFFFAKDHNKGIKLIKLNDYTEAINSFEKSVEYFQKNRWIDKYRFLTLLSSSNLSYIEMDLNNIAFCYAQIGNGDQAKYYYQKVLNEFPDSTLAKTALNILKSGENIVSKKTIF